jgi:hypothetical protein
LVVYKNIQLGWCNNLLTTNLNNYDPKVLPEYKIAVYSLVNKIITGCYQFIMATDFKDGQQV